MQQPMGQPMGQPMEQQMYNPMYNQMYPQPKKKNTGLIIGIISAIAVLVVAIVAIVLVLVLGVDKETKPLIGTWVTEDGVEMTLKKNNEGTMGEDGFNLPITWKKSGDKLELTVSFMGMSETESMTIVEVTKKKLVLEDEYGDQQVFTKK